MINTLEEDGFYGEVLVRARHMPDCFDADELDRIELAGWEYSPKKVSSTV